MIRVVIVADFYFLQGLICGRWRFLPLRDDDARSSEEQPQKYGNPKFR
jgi:hypothetical protein